MRLVSLEEWIDKLPQLGRRLVLEHAGLQMRDLVEAVHVELADKGRKVGVLEEPRKELFSETLVVGNEEGVSRLGPVDQIVRVVVGDHAGGQR